MRKNFDSKNKEQAILHIDGDAFFVGVEVAKNPKLKGLPVVTGEERGIVTALSYEAKALGIKRGMPIFQVKREYPSVIVLPGDYRAYGQYSSKMFDIVRRYSYEVEEYSIDECFADLTGLPPTLKLTYREIAEKIKREVNEELGLSVSLGVAPTKVLAKVASSWVKPNGLTVMKADAIQGFLAKIPIEKIWGIGPRTATRFKAKGIHTADEFVAQDIAWVRHYFSKPYEAIWHELHGVSLMKINSATKTVYASIQRMRTFTPAVSDIAYLRTQLSKNVEEACTRARRHKLTPKKFSLYLKDQQFQYEVRSVTLQIPTNAPEVLIDIMNRELEKMHRPETLYRATGVTLHDLYVEEHPQEDLFGESKQSGRLEFLHEQIDKLEHKLGKRLVHLASTHHALNGSGIGVDADEQKGSLLFL